MSDKEDEQEERKQQDGGDDEEDDSKIFPQRLMEILDDETNHEAISWLPHGRAFLIRKRDLFASQVMPKYFSRKAKYSSFTRKLNRWNFVRVSSGPELGAYYHEFFLRDKPQLAAQMFCKNARTILAMANSDEDAKPSALTNPSTVLPQAPQRPVQPPQPSALSAQRMPPPMVNPNIPVTPALLAALTKDPAHHQPKSTQAFAGYAPTNLRLLEMHLQQQEEANRLLLQHAMALSQQQRQQQQQKLANERARLMQMRQLMQMRSQQQSKRNANNHRASAA